jgi:hypothetical protein
MFGRRSTIEIVLDEVGSEFDGTVFRFIGYSKNALGPLDNGNIPKP